MQFLWTDILVYFFKQTVRVMPLNERRDRPLTVPELLVAGCQPPRKSVFDSASVKKDFFFLLFFFNTAAHKTTCKECKSEPEREVLHRRTAGSRWTLRFHPRRLKLPLPERILASQEY